MAPAAITPLFTLLMPKPFRDLVYDSIAKRRYKWFGKNESCQLPDESAKNRILG